MYGVEQYIDQNLPVGAIYSKMIYTPSAVVGGVAIVQRDYTNMGAVYIILHVFILSFAAVAALDVTFTDEYNQPMFLMRNDPASNGIFYFPHIIEKGVMKIFSNNADVKFSVGHQYITVKDDRSQGNA